MQKYRTTLRRTIATLLALGTVGIFSPAVFAANEPFDNTDPASTGCAASGATIYSRAVDGGVLELKWSSGCQTAWAVFTDNDPNGYTNFTLWVNRLPDGKQDVLHVTFPYYINPGASIYTFQLYDGGTSYQVYACKQNYGGGAVQCTNAY